MTPSLPRPSMPPGRWLSAATGSTGRQPVSAGRCAWEEEGQTLLWNWQAHTDTTYALASNPDGRTLASGSLDDTIKLWDLESGALLWSGWHPAGALSVAFAPDGRTLASGGNDATVRLCDLQSGTHLQTLPHRSPI